VYQVKYTESVLKKLKKIDKGEVRLLMSWIEKNLVNCEDPRIKGKPLKANLKNIWRYRIGDYRLLADIQDDNLIILIVNAGHRRDI
jgi:mRNA interferase RelE/StbE